MDGPLVARIRRDSHEDGPGIRSVVFFKGCPLRCVFCHNPETWSRHAELLHSPWRCVGCGACDGVCPNDALQQGPPVEILRDRCQACGRCAQACPSGALRIVGRAWSPRALADWLLKDRAFYRSSGGGVTLSGGEATLHHRFLGELLPLLHSQGVSILLETCGHFAFESFQRELLPWLETIYFDIKLADPLEHRRHTGRDNTLILDNLRRLAILDTVVVHPRIPLIPGITDHSSNLRAISALLADLGLPPAVLVPYNPLGLSRYRQLGRTPPDLPDRWMAPDEIAACQSVVRRSG